MKHISHWIGGKPWAGGDPASRGDVYNPATGQVTGTVDFASAAEVSAVNSVDDRTIPCPGEKTVAIAAEYAKAVRGQTDRYKNWCEHVDE